MALKRLMLIFVVSCQVLVHRIEAPQTVVVDHSLAVMLFASCQVYCLAFEEELTVPLKYLSLFITP